MKKVICALSAIVLTTTANAYDNRRETYAGIRFHKNENITFKFDIDGGSDTTIRDDNFGFGAVVGNRLTDHITIEVETAYTGTEQKYTTSNFNYDIWSNMLNVYLFQEFSEAVSPYVGLGIGFASFWGDIKTPYAHLSDSTFDLSYQIKLGVNFALNNRIDLNIGVKYQHYGEINHKINGNPFATSTASATEFYFGGAYKFSIDELF
ncbi:MAG: porin family protein [Alphaproteobacteria bacterium]|nr:porin family protein [Alphaproteobacteria bacterium]